MKKPLFVQNNTHDKKKKKYYIKYNKIKRKIKYEVLL